MSKSKEIIYYAKGMHCASCEIVIEKKILEIQGIKSVEAATKNGQITIEYEEEKPDITLLNNIFKKDKYTFFESIDREKGGDLPLQIITLVNSTLIGLSIAISIGVLFLFLDRLGVSGLFNISSKSSLVTFFGFGILAGLSSCAALIGGIVLSMSKQWEQIYASSANNYTKFQPHLMFTVGRIFSYVILGGILGLIGSRFYISLSFTSLLIIVISLVMILLALQMLQVPGFRKIQFSAPKFITRYIANENNFKAKYMPFTMGALTFFLPCGFTITAQTIALLSGSASQGALIMGFFALGTTPILLLIGVSSVTFSSRPHWSDIFTKTAGFLVLFFALFNITNQINFLSIWL